MRRTTIPALMLEVPIMGLLKLGSAAIVGSALTLLVVSGPGNLGTTVKQATAPVVSTVEQTADRRRQLGSWSAGAASGHSRPAAPGRRPGAGHRPADAAGNRPGVGRHHRPGLPGQPPVRRHRHQLGGPARLPLRPAAGGTGSGFMIDDQGHILTNNHVVAEADKLEVTLSDGTTFPAKLVGRDSRFDLAVIQADIPADKLRAVKLGDSDQLAGRRAGRRDRQPVRPGRHRHHGHRQRPAPAGRPSRRATASW